MLPLTITLSDGDEFEKGVGTPDMEVGWESGVDHELDTRLDVFDFAREWCQFRLYFSQRDVFAVVRGTRVLNARAMLVDQVLNIRQRPAAIERHSTIGNR